MNRWMDELYCDEEMWSDNVALIVFLCGWFGDVVGFFFLFRVLRGEG